MSKFMNMCKKLFVGSFIILFVIVSLFLNSFSSKNSQSDEIKKVLGESTISAVSSPAKTSNSDAIYTPTTSTSVDPVNTPVSIKSGSDRKIVVTSTVPTVQKRFEAAQNDLQVLGDLYDITISIKPKRDQLQYATWAIPTVDDVAELEAMTRYLKEEWVKYPVEFVKASNLENIYLVKKLYIDNMQYRAATPDPFYDQAVYYDISAEYVNSGNGSYMRNVIHHEFAHLVEYNKYGSFAWNDTEYKACNKTPFTYGDGGYLAYSNPNFANTRHAVDGFITGYGTYGLEEDKAEVFAELFTNYDGFKALAETDRHLKCKLELYQSYLQKMSPIITPAYLDQRS